MARDDRRQGAEDRAAAPDLHGRAGTRLRADARARLSWSLTTRAGSRVERERFETLPDALEKLEARVEELVQTVPGRAVSAGYKRFEPIQQVAARVELAGPQRLLPSVRAGVDIRGDGSTEPFIGRVRRRVLDQRRRETAAQTLRRALAGREL